MPDLESSDTPTPETPAESGAPASVAQPVEAPVDRPVETPAPTAAAPTFAPVVPPSPPLASAAPSAGAPSPVPPIPATPSPVPPAPGSVGGQVPPGGAAPQASGDAGPAKQRSLAVPIIAAAVVAALLGGGAGAGVATWAITSQTPQQSSNSAGSNQTITVSNPDSTDVVTAVAAKAADSVVTISVAAGNSGGTGSGVVLSADGYVLTNTHVVTLDGESADGSIEVTTADGRIFSAKLVGLDPIVDLAVIKLDGASGLTPVEWGDSDALEVGDQVVAIGAPLGLSNTVTDGIVSALGRSIQIQSSAVPDSGDSDQTPAQEQNGGQGPFDFWQLDPGQGSTPNSSQSSTISLPVIQTDAAINPGNSGGALLNDTGQLIGINVAIASTGSASGSQSGSIGVGFSIPSSLAKRVADEIIENGEATHGLLGATVSTATSGDSDVVGAVIQDVTPGGAAADAGLKKGDVVTEFNGVAITSSTDLTAQVRALAAGSTAKLSYQRDGKEATAEVTLGELDS
jgi:putative serine protease PepD